jgi:oligopeptide/dipeptide ABC transporter ATP-binding protein
MTLFAVEDVSCTTTATPAIPLLQGVSLDVGPGEVVGLIGESGSGKTMASLAILDLLPDGVTATGGTVRLGHVQRPVGHTDRTGLAAIFQNPREALNPTMRIGRQVTRVLRAHGAEDKAEARRRAEALLRRCGVPGPANVMRMYPHQLSGGMCQRVMIAMAIAAKPKLLIADEPTTALDTTIQAQIIGLLREVIAETGCGVLLITHDLGVVAELADRVVVLLGGRVMEHADVSSLFKKPLHPYTQYLMDPSAYGGTGDEFSGSPTACPFIARCPHATEQCEPAPRQRSVEPGHEVACVLYEDTGEDEVGDPR